MSSESPLLEKRLSEDSSRYLRLQKWANMSSADALGLEKERPEEKAAAAENPLVFLCARCRRPLGDSLTWVASQEDTNCILLRSQFGPPSCVGVSWGGGGWGGDESCPSKPQERRPCGWLTSDKFFPGSSMPPKGSG